MAASLVLYNSFHLEDAEGWHYVYTPDKQYQNWKFDGPTFYAYTTQQSGTVPIYRDHANAPLRYRFTAEPNPGQGWQRDPAPAFYAYPYVRNKALPLNTVPVYTFYATGPEGWRYSYTTEPLWGVGWQYSGVDFYAPLPGAQSLPPYNRPPSIAKLPVQDEYQLGWGVNVADGSLGGYVAKGLQTNSWNDFSEVRDIQIFSSSSDFAVAIQKLTHYQACALGSSLSASADFLVSTESNQTSLSLEADSTVRTRIELLDLGKSTPQLDAEAIRVLKQDPASFINRYGTHFIGGFIYGGYFTGIINITTNSLSQQAKLSTDLKETTNLWLAGQSATKQFNANLQRTQVDYTLEARAIINGQPVTAEIEDPDALLKEVNQFAAQLLAQQGQGVRLIAVCYSWDTLPQVAQILDSLPQDKRNAFQVNVQPAVEQELAGELARLSYLQNTVEVLLNRSDQQGQKATLSEVQNTITVAISKIKSLDVHALATLNLQSVHQYEVADTLRQKISTLA